MGVYVSEVNMPKDEDSKLVLQIFPSGEVYDGHGIQLGIANWAKAVPVPSHGKLIDSDALKVSIAFAEKTAEWAVPALRAVLMVIDEMPTIIPAESAEEGET